jgi:RNA polymerase sigma factor (sigma-70 family)
MPNSLRAKAVTLMETDTDLGGPAAAFPATQCSLVRAASSAEPSVRQQAQHTLIAAYWKPIYKYIRVKWHAGNDDAKDLTQAFFVQVLEKSFFDQFDPSKARFRTFVRTCVDGFVANERRAANCLKRGGHLTAVALDFDAADEELRRHTPAAGSDLDDYFRQEWVRGLFALAVDDLRGQCMAADKMIHFTLFERYDLDAPASDSGLTYSHLAEEFGLSASKVTNYLAFARGQFRQRILDRLRASTGSEEELQDEVRSLFGGSAR